MNESDSQNKSAGIEEALARLEQRLAKVEMMLGMGEYPEERQQAIAMPVREEGEFEMAVGQNLFAKVGIVVLAIGAGLALSLPWHGLPQVVPPAAGWGLALVLFMLAQWLHVSLPLIARHFRGAGMALLFVATLRLCYFGQPALLVSASVTAAVALGLAVAVNIVIGWWRRSVFLTGLAMVTGYAAALAVGATWYVLGMVTVLVLVAGAASRKHDWPWLVVFATPCTFLTYLLWAIGNPVVGNRPEVIAGPFAGVWFLLAWMVMNAVFTAIRGNRSEEGVVAQVGSVLNCGGYVLFLLHTLIRYGSAFTAANVAASVVLLGIAVLFWLRERSQFATFVYAMTGYGALTMALVKVSAIPELFVWLSAQSLLVVITAIWFRSRFIIVANFLIYLAVVTCYMVLVQKESGISLVFVLVALTSARILKWQKDRLELKTELMRNAYLTSAFIVFPYALYHIVPAAWVAVSWVGIALFYYVMNMLTKARKYRWMGHNTLLLTVVYILIMGIGKMEGTQRIVSFLVLGSVLLVVSLVFTLIRARQHRSEARAGGPDSVKPPAR
jgi:hypothetical protein